MRRDVAHFFELLFAMTEKELRARYKYTVFGFFWLVVNPIIQMLIIGFIFNFFIKNPIDHYYAYLFVGLLTWNFFSLSLGKATPSIVFERALIKKSAFPRAVIPLSIVCSNFIHFAIALLLFSLIAYPFGFIQTIRFPALVLAMVLVTVFTSGLSLLTSALDVKFRDVNFFTQAILTVWFYATPIVYAFHSIPYTVAWVWRLNPMTSIVQLFQFAFINADVPGKGMLAANIFMIVICTSIGILVFNQQSKYFDDWI